MKSFKDLHNNLVLKRFLSSELGTMYFVPSLPRKEKVIIRHFDGKLPIELLPAYVQLYNSIIEWVNCREDISKYIFISNILEIGIDYIIRNFFIYDIAICDYFDNDEPIEPPAQYTEMKAVVLEKLDVYEDKEEKIIHRVIRKSLLEPTGKTYFDNKMNKFIIVEPKINLVDLEEWDCISNSK